MFVLSKLMSAITQPVFWLALWWCAALCLLSLSARWRRAALRMLWAGWVVLGQRLTQMTSRMDVLLPHRWLLR